MARPAGFLLYRPALTALLNEKRWSLSDLASESGLPLTSVSGLANGKHRASVKTAERLGAGIGCDPAALFPEMSGQFIVRPEPALAVVPQAVGQ